MSVPPAASMPPAVPAVRSGVETPAWGEKMKVEEGEPVEDPEPHTGTRLDAILADELSNAENFAVVSSLLAFDGNPIA